MTEPTDDENRATAVRIVSMHDDTLVASQHVAQRDRLIDSIAEELADTRQEGERAGVKAERGRVRALALKSVGVTVPDYYAKPEAYWKGWVAGHAALLAELDATKS